MIENDLLRELANTTEPHANIMTSLCSYHYGSPEQPFFNIVFRSAMCNLNTYLSTDRNFPSEATGRLKNVRRMIGVAQGLKWLGERLEYRDSSGRFERSTYYHCDLKPDNILVCREDPGSGGDNIFFKISDFGRALGRKIPVVPGRRRSVLDNPEVEQVQGTYTAPEVSVSQPHLSVKSEVWPFGCILLLVLVFNYHGVSGLTELFASLIRGSNTDCFYEVDGKKFRLKTQTRNCIVHLRAVSQEESDKVVVGDLLNLLENQVLIPDLKSRVRISKVVDRMIEAHGKTDVVTPKREQRKIESVKFHHCAQSPHGEFEVFHGDGDGYALFVWRFGLVGALHLLAPISPPPPAKVRTSQRIYPHSQSCGSDTICQVLSNHNPLEVCLPCSPFFS